MPKNSSVVLACEIDYLEAIECEHFWLALLEWGDLLIPRHNLTYSEQT